MSGSLNEATLIGNVGQAPEIRTMNNGKEVASFSLATSETWKDQNGERKEATEWHKIAVFSEGLVRVIRDYVHKGSKLMIRGKLKTRKYTDSNGVEKYSTEIVLQGFDAKLVLLGGKEGQSSGDTGGDPYSTAKYGVQAPVNRPLDPNATLDDDIPF